MKSNNNSNSNEHADDHDEWWEFLLMQEIENGPKKVLKQRMEQNCSYCFVVKFSFIKQLSIFMSFAQFLQWCQAQAE